MLRYQTPEKVETITTTTQRLSTKTKQATKNKTNHISHTSTITETKRKLIVYIQNGKYYIEHSAAFALNLTNVRAIMLDKPHLIEIQKERLNQFLNNSFIEIEYQNLDNKTVKNDNNSVLLEELKK